MAQSGKHKLRRWEFPAGSGIRVREIINRYSGKDGGLSYRVTVPVRIAGTRLFRQFTSVEDAESWAKEQHVGAKKDGQKHFLLSPSQREDAIAALSLLEGTGLTLPQAAALAKRHVQSPIGNVTVKDAINKLVAEKEVENLRERSVRDLRNRLDIFAQTFGERNVGEISQSEVEGWLRDLRGVSDKSTEGLSARSKKNYLITVRTFFNWAISKGYRTADNPATKISTPKIDWEAPSILTVEESKKLLAAAKTEQKGRLLASVVLGLFAGIRSNEIMRLDWSAIDLAEGILTIGPLIAINGRVKLTH
jgi:integrase